MLQAFLITKNPTLSLSGQKKKIFSKTFFKQWGPATKIGLLENQKNYIFTAGNQNFQLKHFAKQ